jgi:hypothetical protein
VLSTAWSISRPTALGAFQWARATSPFKLLEPDDPVESWRERMLDLYGGCRLGRALRLLEVLILLDHQNRVVDVNLLQP